ncbi:DNA polymerase-4 [Luteibacter rhizovicinus]|uniref:DNA polymerase IV n=1 Tax=Luteibacter rhizovicinus TaxID=242606 RepID=A0A4R3YW14_9GAMM|nr:DNA polymerase IV [Luteibacter rhizovicinus]TCV97257.1 DNA polymerase-4 [Luteibacter rhizovicinus]
MPTAPRAIIHVDMDAFYASVEQLDDPSLRGRPVIVAGLGRRGVVSTASYEARRYGVRSAMPTAEARRLCPDGAYVVPRHTRYQEVSAVVFDVFGEVTPQIEGLSLDEAFLDVTASLKLFASVEAIGRRVKEAIRERTGLNASVGMATNKLLAKLASELSKPDGFLRIDRHEIRGYLDPLPVGKMWTIGKVAEEALHRVGIRTIGELVRADNWRLEKALGERHARQILALARGDDERPVVTDAAEMSIGSEWTFDIDLLELPIAEAWMLRQCERVGARARARGLDARTVSVKLREPPFVTHSRQAKLPVAGNGTPEIYAVARRLLRTWWEQHPRPRLRLLGVSLSGFDTVEMPQQDMFAAPVEKKKTDGVQDRINEKFGAGALTRAGVLKTRSSE